MTARLIVISSLRLLWACRGDLADMAAPFMAALAWWLAASAPPPGQRGSGVWLAAALALWLALPLVVNLHRLVHGDGRHPLPSRALVRLGRAEVLVAAAGLLVVAPVALALVLAFIGAVTGSAIGLLIALPEVVLLIAAALRLVPAVAAGAFGLWPPWRLAWRISPPHFWRIGRTVGLALGVVGIAGAALSTGLGVVESIATPAAGRTEPPLAGVLAVSVVKAAAGTVAAVFLGIVSAMLFGSVLASPPGPPPMPRAEGRPPGHDG